MGTKVCRSNAILVGGFALLLLLIGGCGSGAVGAPPAPDPAAGTALAVSPPTADLFPDLPTSFTITGGTSTYSVFSSNSVVLPVSSAVSGAKFDLIAKPVTADTPIDITVRDAANKAATVKVTVKPSSLNNQISFTPFAPSGTGCGTNAVCSGGDAQVVVKATLNGVILRGRTIRFDVYQGAYQLVTPGSGTLVNALNVTTDENGDAVVRLSVAVGAATQVATIQSTDAATGLTRRFNFNIVQQVSGVGILSTLPSGDITFKGAKGTAGNPPSDGFCPGGGFAQVDYYVFGGTPPYRITSPLPLLATVTPDVVTQNGGRFSVNLNGCGKTTIIVTDATNRAIETSSIEGQQGDKGDTTTPPTSSFPAGGGVSPSAVSIACGSSASLTLVGTGSYTSTVATGGGAGFSVSPSAGSLPNTVTVRASTGPVVSPVTVNFVAGTSLTSVVVTVTGTVAGACP